MSKTDPGPGEATSLFLLKTKSVPSDGYEEQFATVKDGIRFEPTFIPVLEHTFNEKGLKVVRNLIRRDQIGQHEGAKYGGLIFTSQRSVEAFSKVVSEAAEAGDGAPTTPPSLPSSDSARTDDGTWAHIQQVPIYTVGPATSRALRAIKQLPSLQTFGAHTGSGEVLAEFVLEHFEDWHRDSDERPALLFPVGEQRRDVIPRTLMDPRLLSRGRGIRVDEVVVYGSGERESFEEDLVAQLRRTEGKAARWVVVFSPTGCAAMLRALDLLDPETGRVREGGRRAGTTFVATIGTTTRDHLREEFGFDADVCAETPSPEGVEAGIRKFIRDRRRQR
jgi:uroporphyrinogen-III synthase